MELGFALQGFIIGLSVAAQVGPMSVLCIRRTITQGRTVGLVSGLGIASADALYASIGGFGLTFISTFLLDQKFWLRLIGGLFLCYLGYQAFVAKPAERAANSDGRGLVGYYFSTFALTLTNPATILSFAAILAGLGLGSTSGNYGAALLLIGGTFVGSTLWWLILTTGVSAFRDRFTPQLLQWVNRLSGLTLFIVGLLALYSLF